MELSEKDISSQREHKIEKGKVQEWLGEFFDVEKMNPKILKRLELLNNLTDFIQEEKESIGYARALFDYYKNKNPKNTFSKEEEEIAITGLILADIGKTGPVNANESQQAVIIRLFGIEGVKDVKTPIREILRLNFPETSVRDIELLREMDIDPSMPMEKFWRLHSGWTLEIVEGDGIPEKNLPGAALHHILEGDNTELIDEKGNFKEIIEEGEKKLRFGDNTKFDRPEKLVVLLDKYAAFLTRLDNIDHAKAITKLRGILSKNDRFKDDPDFNDLINDLDVALKNFNDSLDNLENNVE